MPIEVPAEIPPELLRPIQGCDLNGVVTWGDLAQIALVCRSKVAEANERLQMLKSVSAVDSVPE